MDHPVTNDDVVVSIVELRDRLSVLAAAEHDRFVARVAIRRRDVELVADVVDAAYKSPVADPCDVVRSLALDVATYERLAAGRREYRDIPAMRRATLQAFRDEVATEPSTPGLEVAHETSVDRDERLAAVVAHLALGACDTIHDTDAVAKALVWYPHRAASLPLTTVDDRSHYLVEAARRRSFLLSTWREVCDDPETENSQVRLEEFRALVPDVDDRLVLRSSARARIVAADEVVGTGVHAARRRDVADRMLALVRERPESAMDERLPYVVDRLTDLERPLPKSACVGLPSGHGMPSSCL